VPGGDHYRTIAAGQTIAGLPDSDSGAAVPPSSRGLAAGRSSRQRAGRVGRRRTTTGVGPRAGSGDRSSTAERPRAIRRAAARFDAGQDDARSSGRPSRSSPVSNPPKLALVSDASARYVPHPLPFGQMPQKHIPCTGNHQETMAGAIVPARRRSPSSTLVTCSSAWCSSIESSMTMSTAIMPASMTKILR
jgi:hypothetical protein